MQQINPVIVGNPVLVRLTLSLIFLSFIPLCSLGLGGTSSPIYLPPAPDLYLVQFSAIIVRAGSNTDIHPGSTVMSFNRGANSNISAGDFRGGATSGVHIQLETYSQRSPDKSADLDMV
jgi:hypothetical protein